MIGYVTLGTHDRARGTSCYGSMVALVVDGNDEVDAVARNMPDCFCCKPG